MPANKSGLGLQNLVTSANKKFTSSQRASTELIRALMGESGFSTTYHFHEVKEERIEGRKTRDDIKNSKLERIVKDFKIIDRRLFLCSNQTGSWITIMVTTVTGTVLPAI